MSRPVAETALAAVLRARTLRAAHVAARDGLAAARAARNGLGAFAATLARVLAEVRGIGGAA